LEPVVCRRVVGRLPSPSLERTGWRCSRPLRREAAGSLSCEIARIFTRAIPLTTGTFNLVVKDRIAFRLSGAPSVQNGDVCVGRVFDPAWSGEARQRHIRLSSKPFKVTSPLARCQPTVPTGFPLFMHMGTAAQKHCHPERSRGTCS